jgi:hypothetical protein
MSLAPESTYFHLFRGNLAAINQAFSLHVQNGCMAITATGKM